MLLCMMCNSLCLLAEVDRRVVNIHSGVGKEQHNHQQLPLYIIFSAFTSQAMLFYRIPDCTCLVEAEQYCSSK